MVCPSQICSTSGARACTMIMPHGVVHTPVFMPVATQATMKAILPNFSVISSTTCTVGNRSVRADVDEL